VQSTSWLSSGYEYVEVLSYLGTSAEIKAIKSFSSPVVVYCYYNYITSAGYLSNAVEDFYIYVDPVVPTNISIPDTLTLDLGNYETISPTLTPSNAETTLTWTSSNRNVVTVDSDGTVRATGYGIAAITVRTANNLMATCQVTVSQPISPTSISIPDTLTLKMGSFETLTPVIVPDNAETTLTWTSSDRQVATVDSAGKVIAIGPGSTSITVTTDNGISATCQVTVPPSTWLEITSALDLPSATLGSNSGAVPWSRETTRTHDGIDAVCSGKISDNESSDLSIQVTGPASVSFWYAVASRYPDGLHFSIDGDEKDMLGGLTLSQWDQKSYVINSGMHTLKWSYTKDASLSSLTDAALLDQIVIQNIDEIPICLKDSTDIGDGWYYSSWFGYFWANSSEFGNWVWNTNHGWGYFFSVSETELYIFDAATSDWWFVNSAWFPYLYSFSASTWMFYYNGVTPNRHFWNYSVNSLVVESSF
jgi:hypothetical protein